MAIKKKKGMRGINGNTDKVIGLVVSIGAGVATSKGLSILNKQKFMQKSPAGVDGLKDINLKKLGASAAGVGIGAGLVLGMDNKIVNAIGNGIAVAAASQAAEEISEGFSSSNPGTAGLGEVEHYTSMYDNLANDISGLSGNDEGVVDFAGLSGGGPDSGVIEY